MVAKEAGPVEQGDRCWIERLGCEGRDSSDGGRFIVLSHVHSFESGPPVCVGVPHSQMLGELFFHLCESVNGAACVVLHNCPCICICKRRCNYFNCGFIDGDLRLLITFCCCPRVSLSVNYYEVFSKTYCVIFMCRQQF